MKPRAFAVLAAGACILSGCIIIDADETERGNLHMDLEFGLPNLQAIARGQDTVMVEIAGACATKQNLYSEVETYRHRRYEIAFEYSDPDNCNAKSAGESRLEWSYDELGIPLDSTVRVVNRVAR